MKKLRRNKQDGITRMDQQVNMNVQTLNQDENSTVTIKIGKRELD